MVYIKALLKCLPFVIGFIFLIMVIKANLNYDGNNKCNDDCNTCPFPQCLDKKRVKENKEKDDADL